MKNEKLMITLILIICIAAIAFGAYVMIEYGNKPVTEVPVWVLWFLGK